MWNHDDKVTQTPSVVGAQKSAFETARMPAPCIIRICLDEGIIQTNDIESRHDEE